MSVSCQNHYVYLEPAVNSPSYHSRCQTATQEKGQVILFVLQDHLAYVLADYRNN